MNLTSILLLAYLLAGLSRVAIDFARPAEERPPYTRRPSLHAIGSTIMIVGWLPFAVVLALQSRRWHNIEPLVTTAIVFVLFVVLGRIVLQDE